MAMLTKSYAEFSGALHAKSVDRRAALAGSIEVTRRCPLVCSHCYNNLPMGDREARLKEMTLQEHCQLVDQLVDAGTLWLLYSGGEIFARKDFLDIYAYAHKKGMLITLFTNGTLITEAVADYLKEFRPFAIEITLYGRTRETYERLTRVSGSFERCMTGIRLLMERKLPLALKTVGVTVNMHEVWAMKELADELGLPFKFDSTINPRIDCSSSPLAVRLSPEEIVELDLGDSKRVEGWQSMAAQFSKPVRSGADGDEMYHCGGGLNSFAIDPYGNLGICVLSTQETFNVREGRFLEGWNTFLAATRHKKRTRPTKCDECAIKAMCGMCPAQGELEHGDAEKPVEFLCEVAHLRGLALGIPVAAHGPCEYCAGGVHHEALRAKAQALRDRDIRQYVRPPTPRRLLSVLHDDPGGGGCTTCH
jgi:radical SAM protein with 4Fe4S-binding SPASM domain